MQTSTLKGRPLDHNVATTCSLKFIITHLLPTFNLFSLKQSKTKLWNALPQSVHKPNSSISFFSRPPSTTKDSTAPVRPPDHSCQGDTIHAIFFIFCFFTLVHLYTTDYSHDIIDNYMQVATHHSTEQAVSDSVRNYL